jgi:hypothetical protein
VIPTEKAEKRAKFVYCMEDILDLYHSPYDPARPLVCFDESNKQLLAEVRQAYSLQPGQPERYDYEYERHGSRNLFMFFEPLRGWRHVEITAHRKKDDWAECMRYLVDKVYPDAEQIRVVMDNLNTHRLSVLYDVFPPTEARRLCQKVEIHYTPEHASWLNMAEIEFSVLGQQCLDRRIPGEAALTREVTAWEAERNARQATVHWQFTTEDARIKLRKLYPSINE